LQQVADAPFVNVFDAEVQTNREAVFAELRQQTSVVQTPIGVSVIRRDAAHKVLTDPTVVHGLSVLQSIMGSAGAELSELLGSTVLALDGEDHARIRRLVSRSFTPKAADRHRPRMRELTEELVDGFAATGRCELVADFADHYPVQVICEVLGVPPENHQDFARWGDVLTYILSLELGSHVAEVERAVAELNAYLTGLIEDRMAAPQDDLVTSLVQASEGGDRLSEVELRALIGGLLFAGYDTTRNQLGFALYLFTQHPEQWALLAERSDLAPQAVNEVMRVASVVAGTIRIATQPLEVDGWSIPTGTFIYLSLASANQDEEVWEVPARFDITREGTSHLSFGAGPHYCLGANLARAEMEEALAILARRLPDVALEGEPVWRTDTGITGTAFLPLRFTPS
jgi:cytochrome P450